VASATQRLRQRIDHIALLRRKTTSVPPERLPGLGAERPGGGVGKHCDDVVGRLREMTCRSASK
jgi:hypothetical protein